MPAIDNLPGADDYVLQEAISLYSDEAYTEAKKLSGTAIVGSNPLINTDTETFIGQIRWMKPMNPNVNTVSLTDPTPGTTNTYSSDYLKYIKSARAHGMEKVNMQSLVTQVDGLAKFGRDLGELRGQDEHSAVMAILKGVAISEALNGAAVGSGFTGLGGQTFDNDPTDRKYGFYVDLGSSGPVVAATDAIQGAARATAFLNALSMAYKDYEPEYVYLITSPKVMASFRSANLVDADRVEDGNIMFNTLFQGKFRLIQTRTSQKLLSAEMTKINTGAGVDIVGTDCSFIVLPGAIAMEALMVPEPTEIQRDAKAFKGGGTTAIWHRWGWVMHPAGYSWNGDEEDFVTNVGYRSVNEAGTQKTLVTATNVLADTSGVWQRKASSALSLGILPVFHG